MNKGYQQFLKTSKTEVPATADHLKGRSTSSGGTEEALNLPSLYNEALGTVSESYQYDRIKDRDKPEVERPKRPAGGDDQGDHQGEEERAVDFLCETVDLGWRLSCACKIS